MKQPLTNNTVRMPKGISADELRLIKESLSFLPSNATEPSLPVYDVVDFFSGCGGMSYGFHRIGEYTGKFNLVGAFDNNRHANATYEKNFKKKPVSLDIAESNLEIIEQHLHQGGRNKQNALIAIGCAPCQGFSSHRKKDRRKDIRNSLVGRFGEIAVGLGADIIVMENVPDLLAEKHWHHYQAFTSTLRAHGYKISTEILSLATFGVPQERFRTVVIAAKEFVPSLPSGRYEGVNFRTVRDAIGSLETLSAGESSITDPTHVTSKHRPETVEIIKQVPKNGGSRPFGVGPGCLDKVKGFYDVYGRLHWDRPAVTITARCRTPSCGRFVHPEQDRGLSIREAALLQGFPSHFFFEGPFDDKFKQIGNAVPPVFSTHLAAHILGLLSNVNRAASEDEYRIDKPVFKSFSGSIGRRRHKPIEMEQAA